MTEWSTFNNSNQGRYSEALTTELLKRRGKGEAQYFVTLMFSYIPGLVKGGLWNLELPEQRTKLLWHSVMNNLYNNKYSVENVGYMFFDRHVGSISNSGLHVHGIWSIDERKFKAKWRGNSTIDYMKKASLANLPPKAGVRDILTRVHIGVFDGNESGVQYCMKSTEFRDHWFMLDCLREK